MRRIRRVRRMNGLGQVENAMEQPVVVTGGEEIPQSQQAVANAILAARAQDPSPRYAATPVPAGHAATTTIGGMPVSWLVIGAVAFGLFLYLKNEQED